MSRHQHIPVGQLESCRSLPLEEQADMLADFAVNAMLYRSEPGAPPDSAGAVGHAVASIDRRQCIREVLESMCRPLSKEQVQSLAAIVILRLCDFVELLA